MSADTQKEYLITAPSGVIVDPASKSDVPIRMRPHKAKSGNIYFSLTNGNGNAAPFGLPVPPEAFPNGLPTEVEFQGRTLPLEATVTKPNPKTGKGGGNACRRFEDKVQVHGEERILKVIFTSSKDGAVNVTASMRRGGSNGGRKTVAVAGGIG